MLPRSTCWCIWWDNIHIIAVSHFLKMAPLQIRREGGMDGWKIELMEATSRRMQVLIPFPQRLPTTVPGQSGADVRSLCGRRRSICFNLLLSFGSYTTLLFINLQHDVMASKWQQTTYDVPSTYTTISKCCLHPLHLECLPLIFWNFCQGYASICSMTWWMQQWQLTIYMKTQSRRK